nr:integrase arm-type DNA-binding domain-containing protein [uncultured Deefgea sp.]
MARQTKPLSPTECSSAKAKEKDYRLYDGGGLFLLIKSNGTKIWRFKYTKPNGVETLTSFGEFPVVTLANARGLREEAKSLLAKSLDPIEERNRKKKSLALKISVASKLLLVSGLKERWLLSLKAIETARSIALRAIFFRGLAKEIYQQSTHLSC